MESTVKIWITKDNFSLIQKGLYPTNYLTTEPRHISDYVEMNVSVSTLSEWANKRQAEQGKKSNKTLLTD